MKKHIIKTEILLFIFVWIFFSVSGCSANSGINESSISSDYHISEIMPEEEKTPSNVFVYTFNPHVISEEYSLIYGEGINEEFFSFCDAILKKEKSFSCSSREAFYNLLSISNFCFPLAQELINSEESTYEDGICHLVYRYNEEKLDELILSFRDKVTNVISSAIPYDEPDSIKAMELFTAVANKDTYDDSNTLEDSLELRSYRSIMEDVGICQEIAAEYIYYLLH